MNSEWINELPLVAAFVFFCLTLIKLFLDFLKARDAQWQAFIAEQRSSDRTALAKMAEEIRQLAGTVNSLDQEVRQAGAVLLDRKDRPAARQGHD